MQRGCEALCEERLQQNLSCHFHIAARRWCWGQQQAFKVFFQYILQATYVTHCMCGTAVLAVARRFRRTLHYSHTHATTPPSRAANMDMPAASRRLLVYARFLRESCRPHTRPTACVVPLCSPSHGGSDTPCNMVTCAPQHLHAVPQTWI